MIEGQKIEVNEASIRYQARTKLAELVTEIAGTRKLDLVEDKIKQATQIRLLLKALDYGEYLTRTERERIWYALIEISGIYDFPTSPILELRNRPNILLGYTITNTVTNNITGADTLLDGEIFVGNALDEPVSVAMTGDIGISNTGVTAIQEGVIVNADINASAAIAFSKMAALTGNRVAVTTAGGVISTSAITTTQLGYLSTITGDVQTQIDGKLTGTLLDGRIFVGNVSNVATGVAVTGDIGLSNAGVASITAGAIVNADVNASAAIAYSKLALTGSIVNADINASAAIAYSKLALTGTIVNADINASAAIAMSKLAALTASRAVVTNGSGVLTTSAVLVSELAFVSGVTSSIQTQLNALSGTQYDTIQFVIDGGGSTISTGQKGHIEVPFNCTVTGWSIYADQSGSAVVDVWKDTYANFPPSVADTITGSEKPTLSAEIKNQDLTLSTWTTSFTKGDILAFNVDSASTVQRLTVVINVTK
jgi:hypothetical protein